YLNADCNLSEKTLLAVTANYTGKMLIPYFGTETVDGEGELRTSERFMDLGLKLEQGVEVNGANLKLFGGVRNIFNSYQSDFDEGINRDPAYIYGPLSPRTVYIGIKIGDMAF
ncbi:MAG: TonB-dependent receptor, partial [Bacteroidales bacterium]